MVRAQTAHGGGAMCHQCFIGVPLSYHEHIADIELLADKRSDIEKSHAEYRHEL